MKSEFWFICTLLIDVGLMLMVLMADDLSVPAMVIGMVALLTFARTCMSLRRGN